MNILLPFLFIQYGMKLCFYYSLANLYKITTEKWMNEEILLFVLYFSKFCYAVATVIEKTPQLLTIIHCGRYSVAQVHY